MFNIITRYFPLWAVLLSSIAYAYPAFFADAKTLIIPLLSLVMFCMGMTLQWKNFADVLRKPLIIIVAVCIQYGGMPLLAWGISLVLQLPPQIMLGMVLVGTSAGGTASNVMCYLAGGNVALSILMTLTSTLLSMLLMPALTELYLGANIDIPALKMLQSIFLMVVIPVLLGTAINSFWVSRLRLIKEIFPALSSLSIILIIAIIIGVNHHNLQNMASWVLLAVILHNLSGLSLGYFVCVFLKYDKTTARTVAIEVGMQNSGLSVALAVKHFSVLSALPGALFSIWHNLSGSMLAFYWKNRDKKQLELKEKC